MFISSRNDLGGKSGKEKIVKVQNVSNISRPEFICNIAFLMLTVFLITPVCSNAAGGSGTESDPYIIENCLEIQAIEDDLDAYYVLGNNIDCSATLNWNGGYGFIPIGGSSSPAEQFNGYFDGQGYKITDVYINRPDVWNIGLFAYTSYESEIENLVLERIDIKGRSETGGLVGRNLGTVTNSYSTGSVNCTVDTVGGLVGANHGIISNSYSTANVSSDWRSAGGLVGANRGKIIESYATGNVSTDDDDVGGLVGWNTGEIFRSHAAGNVSGNNATVGGLAGSNQYSGALISDCYATGNINAGSGAYVRAGGLVGLNGGTGWNDEIISNSYSTGNVNAITINAVGGLIGANYTSGQTINNCFWDIETSGQLTSDGGTGKTTAEMKTKTTFTDAGWDFDNIWHIGYFNTGYPYIFNRSSYVAIQGNDSGNCSTPAFPCRTIQYALDQIDRGVIKVSYGQYLENIVLNSSKNGVEIQGGWNTAFSSQLQNPSLTIINGNGSDRVIRITAESQNIGLKLTGLTLKNGMDPSGIWGFGGGGIYILSDGGNLGLSLKRCAVQENNNGGIVLRTENNGQLQLTTDSCVITDNITGGYGGGLDAYSPSGNLKIDIENTIIANNHASHRGGGIRVFSAASQAELSIKSSTISGNSGSDSGGVYLSAYGGNFQAGILNSIIWGNRTRDLDLIIQNVGMGTTMSVGAMYSDIGIITDVFGLYSDNGNNINENPLFKNPAGGDYHLKEESPAIDNALCGLLLIVPPPNYFMCLRMSPLLDFEGDSRPSGCLTGCDMGADEFKPRTFPWILFYPAIIGAGR